MYIHLDVLEFRNKFDHLFQHLNLAPPIIVGGTGGSGTRLIAQLLQNIDVFMGMSKNESEDAIPFIDVYEQHINQYLNQSLDTEIFILDLEKAVKNHIDLDRNLKLWGWKNPRSIYLLPLFNQLFSDMRYIHVVRNGITMSTSTNQQQLLKHGQMIIANEDTDLPYHEKSLLLWSTVNSCAADYAKKNLGDRYLCIRYEDACDNPIATLNSIADFLKIPFINNMNDNLPRIEQSFRPNPNISEYVLSKASNALKRFGYAC